MYLIQTDVQSRVALNVRLVEKKKKTNLRPEVTLGFFLCS